MLGSQTLAYPFMGGTDNPSFPTRISDSNSSVTTNSSLLSLADPKLRPRSASEERIDNINQDASGKLAASIIQRSKQGAGVPSSTASGVMSAANVAVAMVSSGIDSTSALPSVSSRSKGMLSVFSSKAQTLHAPN